MQIQLVVNCLYFFANTEILFMLGKKLDLKDGMFDVSKLGRHCYVLVHNYKVVLSI